MSESLCNMRINDIATAAISNLLFQQACTPLICVRTLSNIRSSKMMTPMRYVFLVLMIIVSTLYLLQLISLYNLSPR
jgi:hypothetical protein